MRHIVRGNSRGFTLVEMTVTVALVGILGMATVYAVRKYIQSAKASEAIQMIGSIKAAQEAYRAETFAYKDCSGNNTFNVFYPMTSPSNKGWAWGDTASAPGKAYQELGVSPDGLVYMAYACAAGDGSIAIPSPGVSFSVANWPSTSNGAPWYVVKAVGDLDNDTVQSTYLSSSFTGQIIIDKDGE